jgi:tetratricopeptide (TPR) repeat protein
MAMVANKPADALRIARTVQSQRPNEAIGFLLEGDIHVAQKNFSEAVAAYTAGSSKKSIGRLQIKLYETLQMAKRQQEVDRFPAAWLKNHPKDVEFLFYLGDQALARGAYAEAEKRYIEVLLIDTKNYNAMNNLAWLMLQQKKEGAVAMAASAVALAPKHPAILDTYAMTLKEEKKLPEALVAEKKAVALAPDMPQFKLNLAKIHLAMGDTAQAKKELDALSKLGGAYGNQAEVAAMMKALTQ